ncbi:hypothetical protein JQ615_17985 [Bradyrhizobium jicamae]|uniref:Uncharacterized protein n=1 Tax=Bradyrhizobium jicamae TaxID=280332 RepID=A0ABS5FKI3_9BRAD|nr:hypothetical protein [Bradyrhizobium jicamae]MBR0797283.1 hypothetical protein [Bradyrhizobium jicamae]
MKWMKERDLLLAQTAAFVQSVTGKRPNIEAQSAALQAALQARQAQAQPGEPRQSQTQPAGAQPTEAQPTEAQPAQEQVAQAEISEPKAPQAQTPVDAGPPLPEATVTPPLPVPTVIEGPPTAASAAPATAVTVVEVPPTPLPQFARLDLRGDFQSEVRDRVASFRAQQQRFLKEREEYCSSTMAKVRAAIRDLPHSDK